jgi:hypothetical protein
VAQPEHAPPPTPPTSARSRSFSAAAAAFLPPASLSRTLFRRSPRRHDTIYFATRHIDDSFTAGDADAEDIEQQDRVEDALAPATPPVSWRAAPAAVARRARTPQPAPHDDGSDDDDDGACKRNNALADSVGATLARVSHGARAARCSSHGSSDGDTAAESMLLVARLPPPLLRVPCGTLGGAAALLATPPPMRVS